MNSSLKRYFSVFFLSASWIFAEQNPFCLGKFEESSLFHDLELAEVIRQKTTDKLPYIYNYSLLGGYFTMPSARMDTAGIFTTSITSIRSHQIYAIGFQFFDRVQISINYQKIKNQNANRAANIKLGLIAEQEGWLPSLAVGTNDFMKIENKGYQYLVMTKQFLGAHLECSLGWIFNKAHGIFGGVAWSPFRQSNVGFLKNLYFITEYNSGIDKEQSFFSYIKKHIHTGFVFSIGNYFQFSIANLKGGETALSGCLQFPLGVDQKAKPQDPCLYTSPINTEPVGSLRSEQDFSQELAYALKEQGLDLYRVAFQYDISGEKQLHIKIINTRYREERVLRERIQTVLAALVPADVACIIILIEENGVSCQTYYLDMELLRSWHEDQISDFEFNELTPLQEVPKSRNEYEAVTVFQRCKPIWTFLIRPRVLTFFGTNNGVFKYNLGLIVSPEGYIGDQLYYKIQFGYSFASSKQRIAPNQVNLSYLPIVRSDTLSYLQPNRFSLEEAYLQKAWNLGRGWFFRTSTGYFEIAYAGVAAECLLYPVNSSWAVGLECSINYKRKYKGIACSSHTKQLQKMGYAYIPFTAIQYFLDVYYDYKPLHIDLQISAGRFLAKDKGVRIELGRYFPSGLRFSIWLTITNGHDKVNGQTYYDKGFCFVMPLDLFLPRSSRNYLGFSMTAWLRDVGARAKTGIPLYDTLYRARYNY